ncbi:MAG TPA: hypothetical protein VFS63_13945 [Pseudolabrys sp.]|jgi:hypothetical protein|nr:hypothetical protein [Pseudolabrys sp.]
MILGMSLGTFTALHVIICLIGLVAGLVVVFGMFGSRRLAGWTAVFLISTILISVTGFMFPIHGLTPALATGIVSIVLLGAAVLGLYVFRLEGAWRWIYVACAVAALYLNVLVLIVQSFQKVAVLNALAPTQSEAPFLLTQSAALVLFLVLAILGLIKFHPERLRTIQPAPSRSRT